MTNNLKYALLVACIGAVIVATALVVNICDELTQVIRDADATIVQEKTDLHETQLQVSDELIQIHSVLQGLSDSESEQRTYWNSTAKQSTDVVRDLRLLLAHADRTTLPAANQAIAAFSENSTDTLKSLTKAADSLNIQVSNPQIAETFDNIDRTTRSLSQTSAHLDNISAMGEIEVKRLTMPASLAKRLAYGTLDVAGKIGAAFAGFK